MYNQPKKGWIKLTDIRRLNVNPTVCWKYHENDYPKVHNVTQNGKKEKQTFLKLFSHST